MIGAMIRTYASLTVLGLCLLEFAACSSSTRDFGTAGTGGAGDAQAGSGGRLSNAGASGHAQSEAGSSLRDEAGAAGAAEPGQGLEIAAPHLPSGKTYVPYTGSVSA